MKHLLFIIIALMGVVSGYAQSAEDAKELHEMGRKYLSEGNFDKGREYTLKAMEMYKQLFGEVNEKYINSLNNYALSFANEEKYQQAIEYQEKVISLCKKLPTPHPDLGMFTVNMGRFYYLNKDYSNAIKHLEVSLNLVEKFGNYYEFTLIVLGDIYTTLNDIPNMQRIMGLTEEHNQHELTKECNEPQCMLERAEYYMTTGDNVNAKKWYLQALDFLQTTPDSSTKVKVCESYARFLFSTKDYVTASEYIISAANAQKEISGVDEKYAQYMYRAGLYYFIAKEYQKSIDSHNIALNFYTTQQNSSTARKKEAECNKGIGNAYSGLKDYGKAKEFFNKVVKYYKTYDINSEEYPKAIERLATAEKFNKDYDDAIAHYKQAMDIFEGKGMTEDYANTANSLKLCYFYAGKNGDVNVDDAAVKAAQDKKMDDIISQEKAQLELTKTYLGDLMYARSLGTIAGCYYLKEDYINALYYYIEYLTSIRDAIRQEFQMQSDAERMATWNVELSNIKQIQEMMMTLPSEKTSLMSEIAALNYDVALLSKGILLNSSIEFEKVINSKDDPQLKTLYNTTKSNTTEIERLRKEASSDADLEKLLKLMQENQALQLKLYKECAEIADFTDYIAYNWKDVQNAMLDTDLAIEFVAIKYNVFDSDNYIVALVLTKDLIAPIPIPVCTFNDAKIMVENSNKIFEFDNNFLWGIFDQYLTGKKRILFSVDGTFNQIAIEYLKYNGKPLSEQFEVYRLSSTKELCYNRPKAKMSNAVLFGDINYNDYATVSDKTKNAIAKLHKLNQFPKVNFSDDISFDKSISELEWDNLFGTQQEINEIEAILSDKQFNNIIKLTDTEASKEAFLALSDANVTILHMATHGAYIKPKQETELNAMANSIITLAEANLETTGIISAAEIASMNLRQCDFAVFPACESGLGKLGEDGVFGLQRGLKNAGVRSILMTIKSVDDATTTELMISFYRHLMNGSSKREALINAQHDIRSKGFTSPDLWTSFILLDAL